jgi:hypothetical protein
LSQSQGEPYDDAAIAAAIDLLADLQREASREDLPENLKGRVRYGIEQVSSMLEAARLGDRMAIEDVVLGTLREDGKRHPDGLRQGLPYWARGVAVLEAVSAFVDLDESNDPVTVTVHWERVPRKLRPAAASLASELVDSYQPRPTGGRPSKALRKETSGKPGNPDTGEPAV